MDFTGGHGKGKKRMGNWEKKFSDGDRTKR
jgi:hypothetical protein